MAWKCSSRCLGLYCVQIVQIYVCSNLFEVYRVGQNTGIMIIKQKGLLVLKKVGQVHLYRPGIVNNFRIYRS